MKFLLASIQILLSVYLTGEMARKNKKINAFFSQVEDGYDTWNERIRKLDIKKAVVFLKKIYGYISIISILIFLFISHFFFRRESSK